MDTASLRRAYVARLRLYHFGFLSRTNKKVAIKSPVPTSAHTSEVCPSGILPRVRRKMPIINGTTMRKITSFFILAPSGRYLASRSNEIKIKPRQGVMANILVWWASPPRDAKSIRLEITRFPLERVINPKRILLPKQSR